MILAAADITTDKYQEIAAKVAVALGIGLLVGLEREWAQKEVGVRTFAITALLGLVSSLIGLNIVLVALVGILVLVVFLNLNSLLRHEPLELTTSAALVVVMVLGVLVGRGDYFTAASSAILITMLLAWKVELVRFAGALRPEEIRGAVLLGLLSFVIYPLLPNRYIDPWNLIRPREAWVIVVVIAGIGFVNYALLRIYSNKGLYYAAILGGLVNSTAAAIELAASFSSKRGLTSSAAAILLLTNVAMFLRNTVILLIFAPKAVMTAVLPLGVMALATLLFAFVGRKNTDQNADTQLKLTSPVSLKRVLKFAIIFLILAAVGTLGQRHFGKWGFLVVSLFGGLVSSASTTATAADLVHSQTISPVIGGIATVLTSMASALATLPLVYPQIRQSRPLVRRLTVASGVIVILGICAMTPFIISIILANPK